MISAITNTSALAAKTALNRNQNSLATNLQRLSTGKRINSGKDDPAGLISSEQLSLEIRSLEAQSRALRRADANANVTEGHTRQLSSLMADLNGLVVFSANQAGMSDAEIEANQMQADSIVNSIRRFTSDAVTSLGGISMSGDGNVEVEAMLNSAASAAASLATGGANDLRSGNLEAAQTAISGAITNVATARGRIGTFQKDDLQPRYNSNQVAITNLTEARSMIVDTDFAVETGNLTRNTILVHSNMKTLQIAQQQAGTVLNLLSPL